MSLKISRILHAGYIFEHQNTKIVFDPIFENPFSQNCYAFPDIQFDQSAIKALKFSAVFISHYHDDHCSLDSLNLLDRKTPVYLYCVFEELAEMIKSLGFTCVHQLTINIPVVIGSFQVIPRKALDVDIDSIFQIKVENLNILNVVDSWIDFDTVETLAQEGPWDILLWPFQTMREIEVLSPRRFSPASTELPPEWIEQIIKLNPRAIVPSSCQFIHEKWSWLQYAFFPITYKQFEQQIKQALPLTKVIRMNPSVSIILEEDSIKSDTPLAWINPVGEQEVDYVYQANFTPPTTAEISKNFPAPTPDEVDTVSQYCRYELAKKYQSLDALSENYFSKPRLWRLALYDQTGRSKDFFYIIKGSSMQLTTNPKGPVAWLTELPLTKLFGALTKGESLSSLYLRINEMVFSREIELQLKTVDLMEDPLIRCLYTGVFGSYQKAQLNRLLT